MSVCQASGARAIHLVAGQLHTCCSDPEATTTSLPRTALPLPKAWISAASLLSTNVVLRHIAKNVPENEVNGSAC